MRGYATHSHATQYTTSMVGLTVTFGAGEPDQGIPPQTRVYQARPDHRLPRPAFIPADGSFLYCCNSDGIVRSESGHRDNNRWGALLLRCFSFGLDDFIWPSRVDQNLPSDLGLLGLPHRDCSSASWSSVHCLRGAFSGLSSVISTLRGGQSYDCVGRSVA